MKRIGTTSLSICASLSLLTVAIACGSGDADPEAGGNAGTSSGNTGNTSSGGSGNSSSGGNTGNSGSTGTSGNTGTSGSSGSTSNGGTGGNSTGTSVCDDVTRSLEDEPYVDNFEADTRFGGWYAFADNGAAAADNMPTRVADAALETSMALHVTAANIAPPGSTPEAYGAGVGFNLVNTAGGEDCVDVGAFTGISFWAKGTSGSANTVTFQIVHPGSQPTDSEPAGDCAAMCFLHPKATIDLTATWQQYTIAFADLMGSSFDVTAADGRILGFNIITPDTEYEMWIDEVTFYAGTAPTDPVGPPAEGGGGAGGGGP